MQREREREKQEKLTFTLWAHAPSSPLALVTLLCIRIRFRHFYPQGTSEIIALVDVSRPRDTLVTINRRYFLVQLVLPPTV